MRFRLAPFVLAALLAAGLAMHALSQAPQIAAKGTFKSSWSAPKGIPAGIGTAFDLGLKTGSTLVITDAIFTNADPSNLLVTSLQDGVTGQKILHDVAVPAGQTVHLRFVTGLEVEAGTTLQTASNATAGFMTLSGFVKK